jgi:hypothetical protein
MLEIPKKQPIHAAALLVVVACEALSRLFGHSRAEEFFAEEYLVDHRMPGVVARDLWQALRHGLAHVYSPYPILVDGEEVGIVLTWKDGAQAHLRVVTGAHQPDGHLRLTTYQEGSRRMLCLNVESLVDDLQKLFTRLEARLRNDANLRTVVAARADAIRVEDMKRPGGSAADTWRDFLRERVLRPGDL